jgi:hypothetical protein
MSNIVSGLLILRKANSTAWTPALDSAMQNWTSAYISWLETSPIALGEKESTKFGLLTSVFSFLSAD